MSNAEGFERALTNRETPKESLKKMSPLPRGRPKDPVATDFVAKSYDEIMEGVEAKVRYGFGPSYEICIRRCNRFYEWWGGIGRDHCGRKPIGIKVYYRKDKRKKWSKHSRIFWTCPCCGRTEESQ